MFICLLFSPSLLDGVVLVHALHSDHINYIIFGLQTDVTVVCSKCGDVKCVVQTAEAHIIHWIDWYWKFLQMVLRFDSACLYIYKLGGIECDVESSCDCFWNLTGHVDKLDVIECDVENSCECFWNLTGHVYKLDGIECDVENSCEWFWNLTVHVYKLDGVEYKL